MIDFLSRELKIRLGMRLTLTEFVARSVRRDPVYAAITLAALVSVGVMVCTRDDDFLETEDDDPNAEDTTFDGSTDACDSDKVSQSGSDVWSDRSGGTDTTALYEASDEASDEEYEPVVTQVRHRRPSSSEWGFYVEIEEDDNEPEPQSADSDSPT
jgi:hypothetical protein